MFCFREKTIPVIIAHHLFLLPIMTDVNAFMEHGSQAWEHGGAANLIHLPQS